LKARIRGRRSSAVNKILDTSTFTERNNLVCPQSRIHLTFQTDTFARNVVALERLRSLWVAVAVVALYSRVAPVVFLALVALPPSESGSAVALAVVHVAGGIRGAHLVTFAGVATLARRDLPVVLFAPLEKANMQGIQRFD
jgi:hypothetical protein